MPSTDIEPYTKRHCDMRLLWLDLNSSYAHSSLALPAIHAQMAHATGIEWLKVTATINDSIGSVTAAVARQKPDVIAASCWLFTHDILTARRELLAVHPRHPDRRHRAVQGTAARGESNPRRTRIPRRQRDVPPRQPCGGLCAEGRGRGGIPPMACRVGLSVTVAASRGAVLARRQTLRGQRHGTRGVL